MRQVAINGRDRDRAIRLWPVRKLVAVLVVGVFGIMIAAGTTFYLIERWDIARQHLPFDAAEWRANSFGHKAWSRPTRQRMVGDLVAQRRLDRLPRKEVETMLGPEDDPGRWPEWHLKYLLGRAPGSWLDWQWLVIRFGADGRVETYRLVVDRLGVRLRRLMALPSQPLSLRFVYISQEAPMRHPWSVPVLLALAVLAGYAAGARPVQAQSERWPVSSGDAVTLTFPGGGSRRCCNRGDQGHVCAVWDRPTPAIEHRAA